MISRERMDRAMRPRAGLMPDRVPVMCQLSLGHYFLQSGLDAIDIWHDGATFAEALVRLQRRYGFDGILVNLPGRDPDWRRHIVSTEKTDDGVVTVRWRNGRRTVAPPDDNPHVFEGDSTRAPVVAFDAIDPESLFYVEPHDLTGLACPTRPGAGGDASAGRSRPFPPSHWDTLRLVRSLAPDVSVHGEVFSPFSQMMEALGHAEALLALMLHPGKFKACLDRLAVGATELACGHFEAGADAVLISSAYAGAGFLGPAQYREFVLPFERAVVDGVKRRHPGRPVYTHTCGAIGDRLESMLETGTDGIDTLDPPPLGTVDLADAKRRIGARAFIKGNLDPVNTLLRGTPETVRRDALQRVAVGKPGGGFILSTACSVAPHTPPENITALVQVAESSHARNAS